MMLMLYALCLSGGGSRATSLLNTSFQILRCSSTATTGTTCITYRFWLLACDPLSLDPNQTEGRRNKTLLSVSPSSHFFFISTTSFELNSSHFNSTSISSPSGLSVRSIHSLEPGGFDRADLLAGTSKRLLLKDKDRKTADSLNLRGISSFWPAQPLPATSETDLDTRYVVRHSCLI
jgi:hypothetical protein